MGDQNIIQSHYVELSLKDQQLTNYKTEIESNNSKSDGYVGNISYVKVTGENNGKTKTLDLVVKSSKDNVRFRKQVPIREANEQEVFIYSVVIPTFKNFQLENGVKELLEVTPQCYLAEATGERECIVLENLKAKGYQILDRKKPLEFQYVKMILEYYGKWHALSFALKHQKPEVFSKLVQRNKNMFSQWILRIKLVDWVWDNFNKAKINLIANNESGALKKIDFSREEIEYIVGNLFFEDPEYHVFLHGDGWANNFLFKLDEKSAKPEDLSIIDWQCSAVGSPVIDLSFFLYTSCSKTDYDNLQDLLQLYYNSLSEQMRLLGSNPEEIFTFEDLKKQWKKFSRYGIVMNPSVLKFIICEEEEAPDLCAAAERGDILSCFYFDLKDQASYLERVTNNLLHYARNS